MAQNNLGLMYLNGEGVPKDPAQAAKWYFRAAELGLAEAQTSLGYMYYFGQGVPKDFAQSAKWYRRAAEQGSAPAQFTRLQVLQRRGRSKKCNPSICVV